jgi:hypothetical protein
MAAIRMRGTVTLFMTGTRISTAAAFMEKRRSATVIVASAAMGVEGGHLHRRRMEVNTWGPSVVPPVEGIHEDLSREEDRALVVEVSMAVEVGDYTGAAVVAVGSGLLAGDSVNRVMTSNAEGDLEHV